MRTRNLLFPILIPLVVVVAEAGAVLPEVAPIAVGPSGSTASAEQITDSGQIWVDNGSGGFIDTGSVIDPPHPGGSAVPKYCNLIDCFHVSSDFTGLTRDGRLLCRRHQWGSGIVLSSEPQICDAAGTLLTDLVDSAGNWISWGEAIDGNAGGMIVGNFQGLEGGVAQPAYWADATANATMLPSLGDFYEDGPYPRAVNEIGFIVGSSPSNGYDQHGAVWRPPGYALSILPLAGLGFRSQAYDIDEDANVVGRIEDASFVKRAVVWRWSGLQYAVVVLPVPWEGGSCEEATSISNRGEIVGNCTLPGGDRRAVVWLFNGFSWWPWLTLAPYGTDTESQAYQVNELHQVVGRSIEASVEKATLWNLPDPPASGAASLPGLSPPAIVVLLGVLVASASLRPRKRSRKHASPDVD